MRWMIKLPGIDYQEITPVFENLEFEDQLYKERFFRKEINVDLTLSDDDFNLVWALEKVDDPCLTLPIKVQLFQSSTWVDKWEGFLSLKKGDYDLNACRATFKPDTTDAYQCIIDKEKETVDLLEIETRYDVDTIIGQIEYTECTYEQSTHNGFDTVINPCYPTGEGWTTVYKQIEVDLEYNEIVTIRLRAARQYIIQVAQPAPGWINVGSNKWVAAVPVRYTYRAFSIDYENINGDTFIFEYYETNYKIIDIELDNALSFKDVLPYLFDCDQTIISDFFDINGDGTAPDNLAYQYAAAHLQDLYFFQASDVINADASENATKFEVKRGELLNDILDLFNCELFYLPDSDEFRIEHVSYRKAIRGANLLEHRFEDIKNSYRYKYDTEEIPLTQAFKFKYDTNGDTFDNALIEYDITCSSGNDETLKLKQIITNVSELKDNDRYLDENFLFSAVLVIIKDGVLTSANGVLNYNLGFKPLVEALHVYNNPLPEGIVNGNLQQFESTRPVKLQEVTVKMSIDQYFDNFGPNKEYKTQLGWGSVKSAKYEPATQQLTLQLLH